MFGAMELAEVQRSGELFGREVLAALPKPLSALGLACCAPPVPTRPRLSLSPLVC